MPITLNDPGPDDDILASDFITANAALRGKFSTSPGVGIGDGDIASDADINAGKLSSTQGKRITTAKMETDSVDARVLKKGTGPNYVDGAITDAALVQSGLLERRMLSVTVGSRITKAQTEIVRSTTAFTGPAFSGGAPLIPVPSCTLKISGANYIGHVFAFGIATSPAGLVSGVGFDVTPAVAVPVATSEILAVYLDTIDINGSKQLTGNLNIIWIPLS